MPTDNRPTPPAEISGEALLEWERICDELAAAGTIDKADRAVLVLYVETWSTYRQAQRAVEAFGAVVKWPNGTAGPSPHYKVSRECANHLQKLLSDLGLNPTARQKNKSASAEAPAEIEF